MSHLRARFADHTDHGIGECAGGQSRGGPLAGHVRDTEITYQYSNFLGPVRCEELGHLERVPSAPQARALAAILYPRDASAWRNVASRAVVAIG